MVEFSDDDSIIEVLDIAEDTKLTSLDPWVILVVDDDPLVHEITKFALADMQIRGRSFSFVNGYSGVEALRIVIERRDIDLMLLDAIMEDNEAGIRCACHIRHVLNRGIPAIIMRSGFAGWDVEKGINGRECYDDFLLKSETTRAKLGAMLEKWLPK